MHGCHVSALLPSYQEQQAMVEVLQGAITCMRLFAICYLAICIGHHSPLNNGVAATPPAQDLWWQA